MADLQMLCMIFEINFRKHPKSCISQTAMHENHVWWCMICKSCKAFDSLVCKTVKCFTNFRNRCLKLCISQTAMHENHVSHRWRCMKIMYLTDGDPWKSCISQTAMHEIMYPWCMIYKSCKALDSQVCKTVNPCPEYLETGILRKMTTHPRNQPRVLQKIPF